MLNELMNKYVEQFGKNFPIFAVRALSEKEIIAILNKCLQDGKPYEADLNPLDALY